MWKPVFLFLGISTWLEYEASNENINFKVVVDGPMVCAYYRRFHKSVSQDFKKPTPLVVTNSTFIVGSMKNVISGQATTNLRIRAEKDDILRWSGLLSVDADTVVYDIIGSDDIISTATFEIVKKKTVSIIEGIKFPTVNYTAEDTFSYVEAKVLKKGSANCKIRFAIYDRGLEYEQKRLFGYFELDSQLKIE